MSVSLGTTLTSAIAERWKEVNKSEFEDEMVAANPTATSRELIRARENISAYRANRMRDERRELARVSGGKGWVGHPDFGIGTSLAKIAEPVVLVKPKELPFTENPDITAEYADLAAAVGLKIPAMVEQELYRFLHSKSIPRLDKREVYAYMDAIVVKEPRDWIGDRLTWLWQPIDKYQHPIPVNILRRAKVIKDHFGARAQFAVTDYAVVNPDPFIQVVLDNSAQAVFGVWDEPGFADTKTQV